MTDERALDINRRLIMAYMVRERLTEKTLPDLSDVTLTEAVEASKIVAAMGSHTDPERPNIKVHTCHVEPTRVYHLWFWAMARLQEMEAEA